MFTTENYLNDVKENLKLQSDILIESLMRVKPYNFSSEVKLLDFCTFIEPLNYEYSILMFSMDSNNNEVFNEENDDDVFAGSETLIEGKYYEVNIKNYDEWEEFYLANADFLEEQIQKLFEEWFLECWNKIGGDEIKLPSYFIFHDEYRSYDLKENKWIDDDIKFDSVN
ncbi:hypothetical protein [Niallia circulans]|uniref:hypothetical protein n=1 Tax=Niallia circulans TaxID=1397 RepID=UPI00155F62A8|nr:hypothetical protein [Niallia circulans]NRG34670.1 hypothetical protein [Niallia circulans]